MADEEKKPEDVPEDAAPDGDAPQTPPAPGAGEGDENVDDLTAKVLADLDDQISDAPESATDAPASGAASSSMPQPGEAADNESMAELLGDLEAAITDEVEESVQTAASAVDDVVPSEPSDPSESIDLPDFASSPAQADEPAGINMLNDVELKVQVELGRTLMYVEDVLRLTPESVIELDKAAGDPVDIYVNERHVARGEVLVLNENFCVRVSEIIHDPGFEED